MRLTRCTRGAAVTITVAAAMVLSAGSADAGDDIWAAVDCEQVSYTGCELAAGHAPRTSTPAADPAGATAPEAPMAADPKLRAVRCHYERTDFQPPPGAAGVEIGQSGGWYLYHCPGSEHADTLRVGPVWLPDATTPDGEVRVSPAALAQAAYARLPLPAPTIRSSPAGEQLVNLPTWLWVDPGGWGERSATVSVPGVSVTAKARPSRVVWSMGDETSLTCPGPGTPFPPGAEPQADPQAGSPDCGHVYRRSSLAQPDGSFVVRATVFWTVSWSGAGQRGTFPDLTTSASTRFRVVEVQGLVTGAG